MAIYNPTWHYIITVKIKMINEIVITSNSTIECSRAELLNWLNDLLKSNLNKIEQLGTAVSFCQLFDLLYPGKISLAKVNFKAKHDYEFVNNFKVLQQSFLKVGLTKNIEIQKLIKCKYQDNLQFLQWFKKIFECNGGNSSVRQNNGQEKKREREQRGQLNSSERLQTQPTLLSLPISNRINEFEPSKSFYKNSSLTINPVSSPNNSTDTEDHCWRDQMKQNALKQESSFYEGKFQEMENLFENWDNNKSSEQLIKSIRQIIFKVPMVQECHFQQVQEAF